MIKVPFRAVLLSLIALVAIGGLVASNSEKGTTNNLVTDGVCQENGVTLVVDFGPKNADQEITKCVSSFNGTGWQLFEAAGIEVAGTTEYPQSFVCRINNSPNADVEDCRGTPGGLAGSWVYFYATKSTSSDSKTTNRNWLRSPVGAATRKPKCGDYEGWRFVNLVSDSVEALPAVTARPFTCK